MTEILKNFGKPIISRVNKTWFNRLGEKTGRTDIWVVLLSFTYLCSIIPIALMSFYVIDYNSIIYNKLLNLIYYLNGGFFLDFGINLWAKKIINDDRQTNTTNKERDRK